MEYASLDRALENLNKLKDILILNGIEEIRIMSISISLENKVNVNLKMTEEEIEKTNIDWDVFSTKDKFGESIFYGADVGDFHITTMTFKEIKNVN